MHLWPDHTPKVDNPSNAFVAPEVTFHKAKVEAVQPACGSTSEQYSGAQPSEPGLGEAPAAPTCGRVATTVQSGTMKGKKVLVPVAPEVSRSGLRQDDVLELMQTPAAKGAPSTLSLFSVQRDAPLGLSPGCSCWWWRSWPGYAGCWPWSG